MPTIQPAPVGPSNTRMNQGVSLPIRLLIVVGLLSAPLSPFFYALPLIALILFRFAKSRKAAYLLACLYVIVQTLSALAVLFHFNFFVFPTDWLALSTNADVNRAVGYAMFFNLVALVWFGALLFAYRHAFLSDSGSQSVPQWSRHRRVIHAVGVVLLLMAELFCLVAANFSEVTI